MARKKRPKVSLAQPIRPQTGDLEKLFATAGDVEQASGMQLLAVRTNSIRPDPAQPRRTFPEESLHELSNSILQNGVIQPIEVTQVGPDQYMIVHGERRWRAAQLAGLETIPAVVRRRDYDEVTRFVRQLVENIQREDLNDVDRALGIVRLRDLMQEELSVAGAESIPADQPWGTKITWAKVGQRLGYSRQRIHQLIQLRNLPEEIQEAVRDGTLSERDTRIYQGLKAPQQRALHRARLAGDLSQIEVKKVARRLKGTPEQTVTQAIRAIRQPQPPTREPAFDPSLGTSGQQSAVSRQQPAVREQQALRSSPEWVEGTILPPRTTRPTSIDRLDYVRGHLARIQQQGLSTAERREILRLLYLIREDVASLIAALESEEIGD